jgi:hypothetical protein
MSRHPPEDLVRKGLISKEEAVKKAPGSEGFGDLPRGRPYAAQLTV